MLHREHKGHEAQKMDRIRPQTAVGSAILMLVFLLLLSACGSNGENGSASASSGATATKTVLASKNGNDVNGNGTVHGCPNNSVVSAQPNPANVLVQVNDINTTISAHVGDIIEVQLPFGQKWSGPTSIQGNLELQQPAGYAWKTKSMCVWRFIAKSVGVTNLSFSGRALCTPPKMCPMYITADPFTINVTA